MNAPPALLVHLDEVLRVQVHKGDSHGQKSEIRSQCFAALEGTKKACGIPRINSWGGYVFGNNRGGSNDHLIANRHRQDCGICSDTYTISKFGRTPKVGLAGRDSVGEAIINKHRAMRNEALVAERYEFTDECVRLNPAPLADLYSLLYLYKWSNEAAISNRAPIEINRLDNRNVFTKRDVNNTCMANFWLCHKSLAWWLNWKTSGSQEGRGFIDWRTQAIKNCSLRISSCDGLGSRRSFPHSGASHMQSQGSCRPLSTGAHPLLGGDHKPPFFSEARVYP